MQTITNEQLDQAISLLRKGWCRGQLWLDKFGQFRNVPTKERCQYCVLGAIETALNDNVSRDEEDIENLRN